MKFCCKLRNLPSSTDSWIDLFSNLMARLPSSTLDKRRNTDKNHKKKKKRKKRKEKPTVLVVSNVKNKNIEQIMS